MAASAPFGADAVERLVEAGALGMVAARRSPHAAPRARAPSTPWPTSTRAVSTRSGAGSATHSVTYQHGVGNVTAAVAEGRAEVGFLLRPATVAQIQAIAHGGDRMPPKTTFFAPKPATGIVVRPL